MNTNTWYRSKAFLIVVLIAVVVGGYLIFRGNGSDDTSVPKIDIASEELKTGEIEVNGKIACLPYSSNIADESCVKGVKGDDGKMYALDSIAVKYAETDMKEGTKVVAIGTFEPANTSVNDSSVFVYDGVLVVRVLQRR